MGTANSGTEITTYSQYTALMDQTLASLRAPLINGLPLADNAQSLIQDRRLSYIQYPDHTLLFNAQNGFTKLYYIASDSAVLRIPAADVPVVAEQERRDAKLYRPFDELMQRSSFTLGRVNVGMERALDENLRQEPYLRPETPRDTCVERATPADREPVLRLLGDTFSPALDEIPTKDDIRRSINGGHVLVIRDGETLVAALIRVPRGSTAILHWIAVNPAYRRLKLSGLLTYVMDEDSKRRGFRRTIVWVNQQADRWIDIIQAWGYRMNDQRLYTFVYRP